ncbi:DUF1064 domain-containing protein [Bacillus spizizenii]|nr:DUF1064 domain-containing protein [Bacillus spizizenii]MCY8890536.1 DUF1064 domain-containing protein [Bacillus spizizenii]MEC0841994.1 DUF1064 domain-containing protein [Bacillus spizizenii]
MAVKKRVKTKTKTTKLKKPKVYSIDGLHFKTKPLFDFYQELKEHKVQGLINSFTLPTLEEQKTKSKYGAKKCEIDGHIFDSVMEGKFYVYLKLEKQNGNVVDYELQPKYVLQEGFRKDGKAIRAITYISDFLVTYKDGEKIVYDVKGQETADFKLKKKMFDYRYRDLILKCVQYRAKDKVWMDLEEIKKQRKENAKGAKA